MAVPACYRARSDGLDLFVRLTPKAASNALDGEKTTADGSAHLAARVRAAPEKGAANAALERLVADSMGLPKSAARVVSGTTSRLKTVRLSGDPARLAAAVEAAIAAAARAQKADRN